MLGLYLHIPFCLRKCSYCDFFSVPHQGTLVADYVQWLVDDMRQAVDRWPGPVSTVFFGGGTPSLLAPNDVDRLLDGVNRLCGLTADVEITLEANPGTLNPEKLAGYRKAGVNRLSIGLQSLDESRLKLLGRLHDVETGLQAVQDARATGFDNISCDLMFAVPGQTPKDLLADLERLLLLEPEHVAVYGLTVEDGTPFAALQENNELILPDEDVYVASYRLLHDRLGAAGYDHYEVSNFARPGKRCQHNQRYWQRESVLGVGAGAHSYRAESWGSRWAVPNDLDGYRVDLQAGRDPSRLIESFDRQSAMVETVYLGLRTLKGVDDLAFSERFGCRVDEAFAQAVERCRPQLQKVNGHWRFDLDGWLLFDSLILNFF